MNRGRVSKTQARAHALPSTWNPALKAPFGFPLPLVGPTLRRREECNLAAIKAALGWCGSDTRNPASLYSGMIRVAKLAHRCYRTLALTYDAHGYNARVD